MSRKVILTSGLILVGQESRSYIGLAWVIAGIYGVVFSFVSPIQDVVENRLMVTSIAVTVVNLGIGAVSRIPAENVPGSDDSYSDAMLFKILVIGANTLVIGLLAGKEKEIKSTVQVAFTKRRLTRFCRNKPLETSLTKSTCICLNCFISFLHIARGMSRTYMARYV